jgi:hypothetical protein
LTVVAFQGIVIQVLSIFLLDRLARER